MDHVGNVIVVQCSECQQDCWLSQAGQAIKNAIYQCMFCIYEREGDAIFGKAIPAPGAFKEIAEDRGTAAAVEAGLTFMALRSAHKENDDEPQPTD